jgi:hypothetical protein
MERASPFYVKPRLSPDLSPSYRFWRAATKEHVRRAAPLLRDGARRASGAEELAALPGRISACEKRPLMCVPTSACRRGNQD